MSTALPEKINSTMYYFNWKSFVAKNEPSISLQWNQHVMRYKIQPDICE